MLVKATTGGRYPLQGKPGQYITDSRPVEVPNTSYYRRAIIEGSLIVHVPETKPKKTKKREATPQGEGK